MVDPYSIGEMVGVRSTAVEAPFLRPPVTVEAIAEGNTTNYYATWPELRLNGANLHALLDVTAPQTGVEDRRDVVANYRGIHEDGNRSIIRVHRRIFGEQWIDMAHSRRLLWTVIDGSPVQRLTYDDSVFYGYDHMQTETIIGRDAALQSRELNIALLGAVARKRELSGQNAPQAEQTTSGFAGILSAFEEKIAGKSLGRPGMSRQEVNESSAEFFDDILSTLLIDATEEEITALLAYAYNTFVDDEGNIHYVAANIVPEEGISLQAMYHQRLPIEIYQGLVWGEGHQRWFESFSGIDHTFFTRIEGSPHEVPRRLDIHTVRPVLAWSKRGDGERSHIRNTALPSHLRTVDEGENGIHYTDTTTGLVMAALALPMIRNKWPQVACLPKGMVEYDEYRKTPGDLEIPIGAAQTPLLALLSGGDVRSSSLIRWLEIIAEDAA